ncbi:MAG: hypothetical protein ACRESV_08780 [Nevskiales bacterium]
MNPINRKRLIYSILAVLVITAAGSLAAAADSKTATGTIGSVGDTSFTLQVDGGGSLQFITDSNTVGAGELKNGAKATVAYRVEDGQNIAERVEVKA